MRFSRTAAIVALSAGFFCALAWPGQAGDGQGGSAPHASESAGGHPSGLQPLLATASRGVVVPPRLDEVEQMCAMLLGCGDLPLQVPTQDFGLCVRHFWGRLSSPKSIESSLTIRECGLGALSCSQFARCALRGADPTDCAGRGLGASSPVGRCDLSGRALQCLEGKVVGVRDCPRGGELCAVRHGKAECVSGRCKSEPGKAPESVCSADKTRISTCKDGRVVSLSCAALGLRCETVDGKPTCVPKSAPRCSGSSARCDKASAVECVAGHEMRVLCNQASLVCGTGTQDDSRIGSCATSPYSETGDACDPKTFSSRCRGNAVQYCVGGRTRKFGCKTYFGLNRCVGRRGRAHCVR